MGRGRERSRAMGVDYLLISLRLAESAGQTRTSAISCSTAPRMGRGRARSRAMGVRESRGRHESSRGLKGSRLACGRGRSKQVSVVLRERERGWWEAMNGAIWRCVCPVPIMRQLMMTTDLVLWPLQHDHKGLPRQEEGWCC